ncbi:zinc finger, CCHC-type containing protein [Tanacetum coccineum]
MKNMASNFAKLDKFEWVDFRRWQKKMHFLLSSMSVVYVLTTPILEDGENATMKHIRRRNKWENDDYVYRGLILNGMSNPLFYIYQNVESSKELWDSLEAKYIAQDASSKKLLDSNKPKGNNVTGPLVVNIVEHNNSIRYNDNKGKCKHQDTKDDPNKKSKVTCWKCRKPEHLEKYYKGGKVGNKANGSGTNGSSNSLKGATVHVCKDRCWFKTYESLNDRSILHTGNESTALVHGRGCVDVSFNSGKNVSLFNVLHDPNIRKNWVSSSILNHCGYKQVIESNKFVLSKHAFMSTSKLNDLILWHARLGNVHFKRIQDMSKDGLIQAFVMNTGNSVSIIHETTAPYTLQQNGIPERKNRVLKEMVNSMLSYSGLSQGFWGIECIFVGYAEHSKAFRFYVIEPNESVSINSINESRDAI